MASESVSLELWDKELTTKILDIATLETDSNGYFSGTFTIPTEPDGTYKIVAAQDEISASEYFRIGSMMVLISKSEGPTGTEVILTGNGFTENGLWSATFGEVIIFYEEPIDAFGIIYGLFHVPMVEDGTHTITVLDIETEIEVHVDFSVTIGCVEIGVISSTTTQLETLVPYYEQIIEPDINAYCADLGLDVSFDFLLEDADGQVAIHLEKVQGFKADGVNLIIGGRWSSQASGSLSYVNENNMLLFSPSSTSPLFAIPDDNLYRMCPSDIGQASTISDMLWSWGIEAVIVIQRADAWADGLYYYFEPAFTGEGGIILERLRYQVGVTEFSTYLQATEEIAASAVAEYGSEHVGILMISFAESVTMVSQAKDYPTLYSLYWFGTDGTALLQQMIDDAPVHADHIKIFSTLVAPDYSAEFYSLYDRYYDITSQPLGYYQAADYDIAWVIAKAVLESQSTDAYDVIAYLPTICGETHGVTGWCTLDENGDRHSSNYDIWGVGYSDDVCQNVKYGYYDCETGEVIWDTDALGFTPPGQTSSYVSIGSAVIAPSQVIEVPVSMSQVTKIAGLGFDLYWDPAVISINDIRLSDDSNFLIMNIDPVLGKATVALVNTDAPDYLTWEEERPVLIIEIEGIGLHGTFSILDLEEVEVSDADGNPYTVLNVEDGMITIQNLGNIHGYITYSYNGYPMEGATADLSSDGSTINTIITGVSGEYNFLDILLGEYTLTTSHERILTGTQYTTFWTASATVNIIPGETIEVDFSLKIRGDLNENGEVDIGDVVRTANMLVGNIPEEVDITDFNGNGGLDIGDVVKLANYLVGNMDEV